MNVPRTSFPTCTKITVNHTHINVVTSCKQQWRVSLLNTNIASHSSVNHAHVNTASLYSLVVTVSGVKASVDKMACIADGTATPLEMQQHLGRPRMLSAQEVYQYVTSVIGVKNRHAQCVHDTDSQPVINDDENRHVSHRMSHQHGSAAFNHLCTK
jgi:hypothetical protein